MEIKGVIFAEIQANIHFLAVLNLNYYELISRIYPVPIYHLIGPVFQVEWFLTKRD